MPLDPNKLSRNELVQLVNSTSLGECLTRGRLNSQMNRSGRRWHDGRNIRLLDYLRWLVREIERPAKPRIDGWTADHARLATVAGDKGAMTLFGKKPEQHRLFAEHVADSETYVVTAGQGRMVHEWRPKPSKPDKVARLPGRLRRRRVHGRRESPRRNTRRPAAETLYPGRPGKEVVMTDQTQRKTLPAKADQKGLACRHCGCRHFHVVYTRPTWGGRIMRRRECRHCGKRITTWEEGG